jgi:hypothetical protein
MLSTLFVTEQHSRIDLKEKRMHLWNVAKLWLSGDISLRTALYALRTRASAVCGKGGYYHIDPIDICAPRFGQEKTHNQ